MKKRWLPVLLAALLVGLVLAGNAASLPFADVSKGAWYYDAVQYVYENDLFSGTSGTTFEPQTPMTRGMLVSVLWRLDGKPAVPAENPFTDVAPRVWYTSGVLWAASEDIVSGMGGGIFAPNENITREQMASIMMRYAAYKGIAVEARADLSGYADSGKISKWAKQSVSWANAVGILSGQEAGAQLVMEPQGEATRAQVASILMRFKQNVIDAAAHVHTVETDAAVAPSCTQTGLTEGTHCSVCHQILTPQQLIAALGHDLQQHAAKEPTCTESGWQAYENCSRCDYTTYVELGALGHDLQQHVAKDPTCTESGWNAYDTCSRCDYTTRVDLEKTEHTPGEWVVDVEPTDTAVGHRHIACVVCGTVLQEEDIPMTEWNNPFKDVAKKNWFYASVRYVAQNGIFHGTSKVTFEPNTPMNRAMFCRVLANLEHVDDNNAVIITAFSDVASGLWYTKAVKWGYESGVISGYPDGTFKPMQAISRQEMCVMLKQYAVYKGLYQAMQEKPDNGLQFADAKKIPKWSSEAVNVMKNNGYIVGKNVGGAYYFEPKALATRAEVATIFKAFCEANPSILQQP